MIKVFVDGREGTTGLRISERLESRDDVSLILLPDEVRKQPAARKEEGVGGSKNRGRKDGHFLSEQSGV